MQVKALACELPSQRGLPLSRFSVSEVAAEVRRGIVATIGDSTVWRWLHEDAIRPWQHRCWIFPRDPDFAKKAGRMLDLYERVWEGKPLSDDEFVLSTDEKTSIQARRRRHPTRPPKPGRVMRVEHEYERKGAWLGTECFRDRSHREPFGDWQPRAGGMGGSGEEFLKAMLEGARYICPSCGFVGCFECCADSTISKVVCKRCSNEMQRG